MYYQNKQDKQIVLSAFKVTRANFTGEAFDNAPFEGDTGHDWLEQAMLDGVVSLVPGGETTYAVWGVRTPDGEIMLASPGDYIVQDVGAEAIHVCPGPIWELLTEFLPEAEAPAPLPTAEQVEQIVEDAQAEVATARDRLEEIRKLVLFGHDNDWAGLAQEMIDIGKVLGQHVPDSYVEVSSLLVEKQLASDKEEEPAQELPVGGSAAGLQGVIDAREVSEELAVMMNDFCDEAYRMYERLKYGDRFDWKAFYARGLEIADPEKVDRKLVFVKVMGVAEHLTHLNIVTHADMLIAQTKVGIVARQREDMHKALEYVNTARMWIFETASTEERDWIEMQKNLTWSHVVLSIHEQVPEDFDKVSGAVDHMIGSYPLSK